MFLLSKDVSVMCGELQILADSLNACFHNVHPSEVLRLTQVKHPTINLLKSNKRSLVMLNVNYASGSAKGMSFIFLSVCHLVLI